MPKLSIKDISLIAIMTALCIGGSYALIGLPNINLIDFIVFTIGLNFGVPIGVLTGILAWTVYGTMNPLGFNFPIWLSTITGEAIFGFVGGVLRKNIFKTRENRFQVLRFSLEISLWGLLLTILYDLLTNIVYANVFGIPLAAAIVSGWLIPPWFGILHELSNMILFLTCVYPLTKAIMNLRGGKDG